MSKLVAETVKRLFIKNATRYRKPAKLMEQFACVFRFCALRINLSCCAVVDVLSLLIVHRGTILDIENYYR